MDCGAPTAEVAVEYLSQFDLLQIRTRLQAGVDQPFDLMNLAGLQSALAAPRQSMFGEELHQGLISKAAILFILLIRNHAFYDGNKRIAVEALRLFLRRNHHELNASDADVMSLAQRIVLRNADAETTQEWLAQHISPQAHT